MQKRQIWRIGDLVPEGGFYVCTNCGNRQYFEKDDEFTDCDSCLGGDELVQWILEEEKPVLE